MNQKKFSIVIPTYNHCDDLLRPCIESLVKYTSFHNTEIVIVANGCTDNTREYVNSLGSIARLVWHDEPLGYTRAANVGIQASYGDYIILLNNDTEILPSDQNSWLAKLHEPFTIDPLVAATGSLKLYDHDVEHDFLVFCCVMISRDAFDKLGLLDEVFSPGYGEDIDFCMRILDADKKFVCIDQTQFVNGTNVGTFPLWHKGNKTFENISDYSSVIVKRNQEILRRRYRDRKIELMLQDGYRWSKTHISDINQLAPLLARYARDCDHITELGTRFCASTYAFLAGKPKKFITYDIEYPWNIEWGQRMASNNGIEFEFRHQDTTTAVLEETDLIFFDTIHEYNQVKTELELHANKAKRYLLFHDTTTFAEVGELGGQGIWSAIQEFLDHHPEWILKERFTHNNGLTVLQRVKPSTQAILSAPKFSIVIPTYNHCDDLLRPCIDSILAYTDHKLIELVVVANGCTDNTREYVNSLGPIARLVWHDEPLGYPRAINMGVKECRGEFIVLLNNDTELLPQPQNRWLDMLHVFFNDPKMGMVSPLEGYDPYTDSKILIFFYVMIRREVFERIGYLDEIFSPGGCEDIDFSFRAVRAGYRCVQATDDVQYRPEASTNSGGVPIWHKDNRTFGEMKEYKRTILRKNNLINAQRWNDNIKLSLGTNQFKYNQIAKQKYFSIADQDIRADFWLSEVQPEFDKNSVNEILSVEFIETLTKDQQLQALTNYYEILKSRGQITLEFLDIEKVIDIYPKSDKSGKLALGDIMHENRSGLQRDQLARTLHEVGFVDIVYSLPVYSQNQIYSRITATKQ